MKINVKKTKVTYN